jgi:hypothetical protein
MMKKRFLKTASGPESYLYGEDVFSLALVAHRAAQKYGIDTRLMK